MTDTIEALRPGSVEHWAAARPDDVAIVEGERTLTYGDWNDAADRLAETLASLGVEDGDIIAVRTQIRLEWAIISAALAKLGASVLGLNWRLTPDEVEYVTTNSKACGLFCDDADPTALLPALRDFDLKVAISLDRPATGFLTWEDALAPAAPRRISAREAGLVIYTSGTTGLPKGVARRAPAPERQQMAAEYFADMRARRAPTPGDVILCTLPFSHGAGPTQVREATTAGNKMIFQRRFDPEDTLRLIEQHRVTYWVGVPTMLKRIAALPEAVQKEYDVSSLKGMQTGAAPVPHSLKLWAMSLFGEVLHEAYGVTEIGMISHLTPNLQKAKPGSSGKPYRHVNVSVRDGDGRVLPPNQTGEFWIRTPVTIQGYLNAEPLDETTLDKDGFFRSGDVGYLDGDGFLFITDRVKDMIISGGVNIYPAEIEAVLIRHPAVQDVAVIGIPDEEFGEQVKAFVEVKPGAALTAPDLIAFSKELASYKRPKTVDIILELPRNTMGKILKKDLREPYWGGRERKV